MEEQLLTEWQERLGLQDWIILLRYNCVKAPEVTIKDEGEKEEDTQVKPKETKTTKTTKAGKSKSNKNSERY